MKTCEKYYKPSVDLTFGIAIELLKQGEKLSRRGWHGKNMFITIEKHHAMDTPIVFLMKKVADITNLGVVGCTQPIILDDKKMEKVGEITNYLGVWNCTQADMLAEDWQVVD